MRKVAERSSKQRAIVARERQTLLASTKPSDGVLVRLMSLIENMGIGPVGSYDARVFLEKGLLVVLFFFLFLVCWGQCVPLSRPLICLFLTPCSPRCFTPSSHAPTAADHEAGLEICGEQTLLRLSRLLAEETRVLAAAIEVRSLGTLSTPFSHSW